MLYHCATEAAQCVHNKYCYAVERQIFEAHNFLVFLVWYRTSKIKLRQILEYLIDALTESLVREKILKRQSTKIVRLENLKIWRYIRYS